LDGSLIVTVVAALVGVLVGVLVAGWFGRARLADRERSYQENLARLNELVADTERRFTSTFEALAAKILDEKTTKFTENNRARLDELLGPFRERLKEFQKKVEDNHIADVAGRGELKSQLETLRQLNQQIGEDARNLTNALKGEAKTQGTWGEMILERTLELSGLVKGREYDVQVSSAGEEGDRLQPDVVVHLPEDRHLVVDSKVSLKAFERYASADSAEERDAALTAHLLSMKTHIRSLSEKNYPKHLGPSALDFTLMFIPVEPAFLAAAQADPSLYDTAWRQKVVLVGPTTLLATLRVVESIWRLDRQNRNALKIAEQGGRLYDAFVLFMKDLEKAAKSVHDAGDALDSAVHRAHTGRGNLVRGFEQMKELGAKTSRELPPVLLESTDESPESGPADAGAREP
jgi:DNA recombination protein RmuC